LAAQSGVFKAMLSLNSIEAQTGVVEMDDASYEVIHAFVEFMYLESTDKLEVLAEQLYVLADKYDVPKLKVGIFSIDYILFDYLVSVRQAIETGHHR
jgi:hypothetical protein